MILKYVANKDTICAPATAAGVSAIAVIRISGPQSWQITDKLFHRDKQKSLLNEKGYTIHFGKLYFAEPSEEWIDEVLVSLFKGPKSYTGEDTVEISCHGSIHIQQKLIEAFISAGCRLAKPGEFTYRAFINQKLDLSQAEAVSDLIYSQTEMARKMALNQMRGGYSELLQKMRQELVDFAALIELELDFGEEDVEFANRDKLIALIDYIHTEIDKLVDSFQLGNALKNGIPTAIVGKPNAGKSTLLNALLNEEKAIVSHIPGTTRDVVEDILTIDGVSFRLMDTAGLRVSDNEIEQEGIERSKQKAKTAQLVLYVYDTLEETPEQVSQSVALLDLPKDTLVIKIANKIDLNLQETTDPNTIYISAKNKIGLDELLHRIKQNIGIGAEQESVYIISNARHV
ncbi:MAG: tRNA uridine-5-carboxymethylaminomethyl(34) synthesis GTPase MnmE, partial [Bacteroidetes bacterium]|nr:tRNA uridine-5-carboxymethylaminomethyl(34) synthesis GTPase MnmE [Bacteroidota bacterium]